jgi:hypothetical protein
MTKITTNPAYECASLAVQNEARARVREAAQRQRGHTLPPSSLPPLLPPGELPTATAADQAAGANPAIKLLELLDKKQKRFEAERLAHLKAMEAPGGISDTLNKLDKANELARKYSRPK